jgi:hypothetical protein
MADYRLKNGFGQGFFPKLVQFHDPFTSERAYSYRFSTVISDMDPCFMEQLFQTVPAGSSYYS